MEPKEIIVLPGSEAEFDGTCPNPACRSKVELVDKRAELLWRPSTDGSIPTYECKICGQEFQFAYDHDQKGSIEEKETKD